MSKQEMIDKLIELGGRKVTMMNVDKGTKYEDIESAEWTLIVWILYDVFGMDYQEALNAVYNEGVWEV